MRNWILAILIVFLFGCGTEPDPEMKQALDQGTISSNFDEADTWSAPSGSVQINNGDASTSNTVVSLKLSASDIGGKVSGYYASETNTAPSTTATRWVTITDTQNYSATVSYTVTSAETIGEHSRTVYVWYKDTSGNVSATASDSISLVVTDTTAPSSPLISINSGSASTSNTIVTLTLSVSDDYGVSSYYASETNSTPASTDSGWMSVTNSTNYSGTVSFTLSSASAAGSHTRTVYVWFKDASGNVSAFAEDTITLVISDTTAPSSPSIIINNGDASTSNTVLSLTLSASDDVGVAAYYASETNSTPASTSAAWNSVTSSTSFSATVSFTLESAGSAGTFSRTVYIWYKDSAGNVSSAASDSITLIVTDTSAPSSPSISINSDNVSTSNTVVTLTLTASDDYGVSAYYASETSTTPASTDSGWNSVNSSTTYSSTVSFTLSSATTAGSHTQTVYVWFKDAAGNVSVSASDSITLVVTDTTAPSSPSIIINNGDSNTSNTVVSLALSANDDVGVTGYYASESDTTPAGNASGWNSNTATTAYSATVSFTLASANSAGSHSRTVYVWFKDAAGNVSVSVSDGISLIVSDPFTHNGTTYKTVTSPYTQKVWLDRNLGASRVCISSSDEQCFGDYYQWGRLKDGHENKTSSTVSTQATDISNAGTNFITNGTYAQYDWAYDIDSNGSLRQVQWSKVDGTGICPIGFRVPTISELIDEVGSKKRESVASDFLKLPAAGARGTHDGSLLTGHINVWSTTTDDMFSKAISIGLYNSADSSARYARAAAMSIRCIKD